MAVARVVLALMLLAWPAAAQGPVRPAGDRDPVQHGAQPNPSEVRPGSRDGDAPSAAAGDLVARPGRRILGLPATTAILLGGALLTLLLLAGLLIPSASRRHRARGGGTYGPR
jgi:hypothetical protein